ncbi:MAG: hypothetical protein J3Q66DRAFT_350457 [Benniella sp.]|nr:MAG: hypothetical protein J3Q66DRAFT_350457 [Benniella sp.]
MFRIPELNDTVYGLLNRQDLVQCARVNKQWHAVVIPYLWNDLSCLNAFSSAQRQAFTSLLLEDYLQEQRKAELQKDETGSVQLVKAQPSSPSALAKYGCWIQILPDPTGLVQLSDGSIKLAKTLTRQDKQSTEQELLLRFFKIRQEAQLPHYTLEYDTLGSSHFNETIAQLVLPRVRHLTVVACYRGKRGQLWKLKRLLGRCSTALEKLTLEISYKYDDALSTYVGYDPDFQAEEEKPDTTSPTEWSSLKELILRPLDCVGPLQPTTFWSWFYKRCGQVERIEVSNFRRGADVGIAENMLEHMPHLNEITIGDGKYGCSTIKADRVASLLSGSRNGWKVIRLRMPASLSSYSMDHIRKHIPTLEAFHLNRSCTSGGTELVEILSTSPNLHTLCGTHFYKQDPKVFIDQDLETRVLKAWPCEASLKVLRLVVGGIPRESEGDQSTVEEYPGQRRQIQGLVYDRLARLTNLETLSLGDTPEEDPLAMLRGGETQEDCLEMSLESGLHKLSELRKLKELNVLGMKTKIGIKEIQWMTEHWPKLRVLRGLDESDDDGKQVVQWLQEHHPEIDLMRAHNRRIKFEDWRETLMRFHK